MSEPPVIHLPGLLPRWSFTDMVKYLPLRQYHTHMHGKRLLRPRLEAWFHNDRNRTYEFGGGAPMTPHPFRGMLGQLLNDCERIASVQLGTMTRFDSCFANLYRGGEDSLGWHTDDEPWIGPVILSVTLGGLRTFLMRRKDRPKGSRDHVRFELGHGDVFIMKAGTQEQWEHTIRKTKKAVGKRLNLTFRQPA